MAHDDRRATEQEEARFAHRSDDPETAHERRGAPDEPSDLPKRSWFGVLKRTLKEYGDDNLGDWAAALTYYGILSIFPALLVLVSLLGLAGQSATQAVVENVSKLAPGPATEIVRNAVQNLQRSQGAAGLLFFVGLAGAIWSASGYIGAFMRAANAIWDVEEGRPVWKTLPLRVGVTILTLVLVTISALAVVLTGPLARTVGDLAGLGDTAVQVWDIAKWPVLVLIVSFLFALLYYATPNVKHPRFQWVSPGGLLATILWIIASAAFAFYVANFGSYNKTYGSLGGVIVFLVWLWLTNIVILLGAEFNAELERGRYVAAGGREDREPYLEPRDTRKMDKG